LTLVTIDTPQHFMELFTEQVVEIIRRIPAGKVITYGIVATSAGNHCGARQVARILHSSSEKFNLPWHRVVNIEGKVSPRKSMSHLTQRQLLENEGVVFNNRDKIDLSQFLWIPESSP